MQKQIKIQNKIQKQIIIDITTTKNKTKKQKKKKSKMLKFRTILRVKNVPQTLVSQKGQTYFNKLAVNAASLLK